MSDAFNIGIRLQPARQGHGHGTAAQSASAPYVSATYPVNRVDAHTDVTNRAEQRSLEKAGFTREGVLRGAQWRRRPVQRPGRLLAAAHRLTHARPRTARVGGRSPRMLVTMSSTWRVSTTSCTR